MSLSDARQEDDFLEFRSGILLVDGHAVEEASDGDLGSRCSACLGLGAEDEGVGEGSWKAIGLDATAESSDADLAEASFSSATSGDLGFEDHAYGDALAVEKVGCEEGLDGVADGVAKVDEVAEVGLLWIVGDDGGLCVGGGDDEGEEGVGGEIVEGFGVDVGEGVEEGGRGGFEEGKRVLVPDGGGLWGMREEGRRLGGYGP